MSIQSKLRIIQRVSNLVSDLQSQYTHQIEASDELKKMKESLNKLEDYLNNLDHLQPNYNTNEINHYVIAINLQLDILRGELQKIDFRKLQRGIRTIRAIVKFHPIKHSFFEFIITWIFEFFYFI